MPPIVGLTFKNIVMVDLDGMPLEKVKELADKVLGKFKLGGYVILESSEGNYHVVFNKPMQWSKVMKILGWIAIMSNNPNVWKWVCMQLIKQAETLRVSPKPSSKSFKPPPKIVYKFGKQNLGVRIYLETRREILRIIRELGFYENG